MVIVFNLFSQPQHSSQPSVTYSEFLRQAAKGEVSEVVIQGNTCLLYTSLDLGVHDAGGVFAVVARMTPIAANKDFLALLANGHGADDIAHAPFANHLAGHARSALNVVAGTGGNRVEDDFFGHAPGQQHHEVVLELSLIHI